MLCHKQGPKQVTAWKYYIRGMFKKRPNFLNSAPTSKASVLGLLSAPSLRCWQQTAICPVSLCALVVELHPLNWASAQAVRRISDKVTMTELEERVCVKFCCKLGKNFTETVQFLNQAYGGGCMSWTQCYEWFKHFKKKGRMSVDEDPRPGHSTSTNDDYVDRVRAVIRGNRHLAVREVADKVGIGTGSCHQIFTE